jgi:hypothetical protein
MENQKVYPEPSVMLSPNKPFKQIPLLFLNAILVAGLWAQPLPCFAQEHFSQLSSGAQEVAKDLGINDELETFFSLRARFSSSDSQIRSRKLTTSNTSLEERVQLVELKQEILENLMASFLEMRVTIAKIDSEITGYDEVRNYLEDKRDRAVRLNNITNFISTGTLSTIGNAFQIAPGEAPEITGAVVNTLSGMVATGISTYSLRLNSGEKHSASVHPNMLAQIFGLTINQEKTYPPSIWRFLNDPSPLNNEKTTRLAELINRWITLKRIQAPNTRNGKSSLPLLCGTIVQKNSISIDVLDDRSAMLSDIKALISLMFQDLMEIIQAVRNKPT